MRSAVTLGSIAAVIASCSAPPTTLDKPSEEEFKETSNALTEVNDPRAGKQWGLENTGQEVEWEVTLSETKMVKGVPGVDINIRKAWEITQGSPDIKVAFIERSPIDESHPEFQGRLLANHNINGNSNPSPHSMIVAGIIGAKTNNGTGVAGVAPNVGLVGIAAKIEDATSFRTAVEFAQSKGVRIINLSQGSTFVDNEYSTPAHKQVLKDFSNILFVCSAGNKGVPRPNHPASFDLPNVLSIANVSNDGELWDSSNYSRDFVDIAAPGAGVYSTEPGNGYGYGTGTSMAAPHVAGVAALVLSKHPKLSIEDLVERILESKMRLSSLEGMVKTGGMVDARAAIEGVSGVDLQAWRDREGISLNWSAGKGQTYDIERDGVIVDTIYGGAYGDTDTQPGEPHIYRVRRTGSSAWSHRILSKPQQTQIITTYDPVESPHPFRKSDAKEFTISQPGASRLRVHFDRVELGNAGTLDYFRSLKNPDLDGMDAALSGNYQYSFWSHWVEGSEFSFDFNPTADGGWGFRVDYIEYVEDGQDEVPVDPLTLTIQAEDQELSGAQRQSQHRGYTGNAYVNTDNNWNAHITFKPAVPETGTYRATVRYANGGSNRPASVSVGDTVLESVDFPQTGGWAQWGEVEFVVGIPNGDWTELTLNTLDGSGLANIDKLTLERL